MQLLTSHQLGYPESFLAVSIVKCERIFEAVKGDQEFISLTYLRFCARLELGVRHRDSAKSDRRRIRQTDSCASFCESRPKPGSLEFGGAKSASGKPGKEKGWQ
jgi:hypothetical protein